MPHVYSFYRCAYPHYILLALKADTNANCSTTAPKQFRLDTMSLIGASSFRINPSTFSYVRCLQSLNAVSSTIRVAFLRWLSINCSASALRIHSMQTNLNFLLSSARLIVDSRFSVRNVLRRAACILNTIVQVATGKISNNGVI